MAIDPKFPGSPPLPTTTPFPEEPGLDEDMPEDLDILPDPLGGAERPDDRKDPPDNDLGFDPESPDLSDPEVDPLHPARTDNEGDTR